MAAALGFVIAATQAAPRDALEGAEGDALHTVLCAAGYNLRQLLRAIARLGIAAVFLCLQFLVALLTGWRTTDLKPSAAMAPTWSGS